MRSETYRFLRLTPLTNDLPVRWEVRAFAVWRTFSQPIKLQNGRERAWPKKVRIEHRCKRSTNFWPFIQSSGQCSAYNFLCEGATRVVMVHTRQRGHTGVRANYLRIKQGLKEKLGGDQVILLGRLSCHFTECGKRMRKFHRHKFFVFLPLFERIKQE